MLCKSESMVGFIDLLFAKSSFLALFGDSNFQFCVLAVKLQTESSALLIFFTMFKEERNTVTD